MNKPNSQQSILSDDIWQWCATNLLSEEMSDILSGGMEKWCEFQKAKMTSELEETIKTFSDTAANQLIYENDISGAVDLGLSAFQETNYDNLVDDEEQLTQFLVNHIVKSVQSAQK